ncbi:MAG: GNAT family N-acetyltransferase [Myxococcales bacterium]|nr:GNAT family N-acetyltransferase [Myxococcales bacterium]
MRVSIRPAHDSDGYQLIRLIENVFFEYPGCVMDVDGEIPELRHIQTEFAKKDGEFWVAERARRIIGCIGYTPLPKRARTPRGIELKKLYVERCERGNGLAGKLLRLVEDAARTHEASFVELWSDTRFLPAHRFYEKRGYLKGDDTRELFDQSDTVEFYFKKQLES